MRVQAPSSTDMLPTPKPSPAITTAAIKQVLQKPTTPLQTSLPPCRAPFPDGNHELSLNMFHAPPDESAILPQDLVDTNQVPTTEPPTIPPRSSAVPSTTTPRLTNWMNPKLFNKSSFCSNAKFADPVEQISTSQGH
jgi:hypothetical protein